MSKIHIEAQKILSTYLNELEWIFMLMPSDALLHKIINLTEFRTAS